MKVDNLGEENIWQKEGIWGQNCLGTVPCIYMILYINAVYIEKKT